MDIDNLGKILQVFVNQTPLLDPRTSGGKDHGDVTCG